jgi:hypothetical protein
MLAAGKTDGFAEKIKVAGASNDKMVSGGRRMTVGLCES